MKYGNCLFGAIFLLWVLRKQNPICILRVRPGTLIPHFMVRTDSELHHYKLDKNVLCWPFCYIVFKGSFQKLKSEQEILFQKGTASQIG
jgi:hypothetical protein